MIVGANGVKKGRKDKFETCTIMVGKIIKIPIKTRPSLKKSKSAATAGKVGWKKKQTKHGEIARHSTIT